MLEFFQGSSLIWFVIHCGAASRANFFSSGKQQSMWRRVKPSVSPCRQAIPHGRLEFVHLTVEPPKPWPETSKLRYGWTRMFVCLERTLSSPWPTGQQKCLRAIKSFCKSLDSWIQPCSRHHASFPGGSVLDQKMDPHPLMFLKPSYHGFNSLFRLFLHPNAETVWLDLKSRWINDELS